MVQVPVVAWFPIADGSAQLIPYRLAVGIVLPLGSRGGRRVGVGQPRQARDVDEVLLDGPENTATNEAQQADDASDDANGSERRIRAGLLALVGGVGGLGDFGLVGFRIDCFRSFRLSVVASVVASALLVAVASAGAGVASASATTVESATWAAGPAGAASWALAIVLEKPKLIAIVKVTSVLRTPRD